jgi:hypothetical protein
MKEMNTLEAQLRSWTPRRPSPGLERRVLGSGAPWHFSFSRLATVLAPTAACLLLTLSMVKQSAQELLPGSGSQNAMVAMGLSNQNFAAYLPGSFQPTANRLDATFEWTNRGYSKSSMDSLTPPKATDLQ